MSVAAGHALEQALAYYRAPALLSVARVRPLPEDVIDLLRIAAGDVASVAQCAASSGEGVGTVTDAAVFFVQQVLFAKGADSYRVLGVNADAPDARIKEHYRWLVRWLHPDRNRDDWDSVYADRVNAAWQVLRLPDRRRDYDRQRAIPMTDMGPPSASAPTPTPPLMRPQDRFVADDPTLLSPRAVQQLPVLVLGGLGGMAIGVLGLMWLTADPTPTRTPRGEVAGLEQGALRTVPEPARPELTVAMASDPAPLTVADAVPAEAMPPAANVAMPEATVAPEAAPQTNAVLFATAPRTSAPAAEAPAPAPEPRVAVAPPPRAESAVAAAPPTRSRPVAATSAPPAATATAHAEPAPAAAPPAATPAVAMNPDEAAARALVGRFSHAYSAGDITALMRLFTADARNNRGGRDAIVYDYQSLFSGSTSRELHLQPTGWIAGDDGATLLADYDARVLSVGKRRAEASQGRIRFDLRRENGELRISQVRHGDAIE